jgi:hypothetical protein
MLLSGFVTVMGGLLLMGQHSEAFFQGAPPALSMRRRITSQQTVQTVSLSFKKSDMPLFEDEETTTLDQKTITKTPSEKLDQMGRFVVLRLGTRLLRKLQMIEKKKALVEQQQQGVAVMEKEKIVVKEAVKVEKVATIDKEVPSTLHKKEGDRVVALKDDFSAGEEVSVAFTDQVIDPSGFGKHLEVVLSNLPTLNDDGLVKKVAEAASGVLSPPVDTSKPEKPEVNIITPPPVDVSKAEKPKAKSPIITPPVEEEKPVAKSPIITPPPAEMVKAEKPITPAATPKAEDGKESSLPYKSSKWTPWKPKAKTEDKKEASVTVPATTSAASLKEVPGKSPTIVPPANTDDQVKETAEKLLSIPKAKEPSLDVKKEEPSVTTTVTTTPSGSWLPGSQSTPPAFMKKWSPSSPSVPSDNSKWSGSTWTPGPRGSLQASASSPDTRPGYFMSDQQNSSNRRGTMTSVLAAELPSSWVASWNRVSVLFAAGALALGICLIDIAQYVMHVVV